MQKPFRRLQRQRVLRQLLISKKSLLLKLIMLQASFQPLRKPSKKPSLKKLRKSSPSRTLPQLAQLAPQAKLKASQYRGSDPRYISHRKMYRGSDPEIPKEVFTG